MSMMPHPGQCPECRLNCAPRIIMRCTPIGALLFDYMRQTVRRYEGNGGSGRGAARGNRYIFQNPHVVRPVGTDQLPAALLNDRHGDKRWVRKQHATAIDAGWQLPDTPPWRVEPIDSWSRCAAEYPAERRRAEEITNGDAAQRALADETVERRLITARQVARSEAAGNVERFHHQAVKDLFRGRCSGGCMHAHAPDARRLFVDELHIRDRGVTGKIQRNHLGAGAGKGIWLALALGLAIREIVYIVPVQAVESGIQ